MRYHQIPIYKDISDCSHASKGSAKTQNDKAEYELMIPYTDPTYHMLGNSDSPQQQRYDSHYNFNRGDGRVLNLEDSFKIVRRLLGLCGVRITCTYSCKVLGKVLFVF